MMKGRLLLCLLLLLLGSESIRAQEIDFAFLRTRAEATDYQETTRYDEVIAFTEIAANASARLHLTHFGFTNEGRRLPLVVFGDVESAEPEAVLATGKTRVFIQANIHAGEVCGKEAMLMLLRGLAAGQHSEWADSLVILIAPIYNADGNERMDLNNRPRQNGPVGGMGQRPNAQGLDLNRDHMKLDSPEARSLVRLFNRYDPHLVVDLHTTNGTYHGYHLTYSPPLHPNTPTGITRFLREMWLPTVTERIKEEYGWDYYYYGNVPPSNMTEVERGWYTFDHRPRFNNNYTGLRNRFAILSEAYAYATFEERVLGSLYFVEEILDVAHDQASQLRTLTQAADAENLIGKELAVQATFERSAEPVDILMGAVKETHHPFTGELILQRLEEQTVEAMPEFGTFQPTEMVPVPQAYLVPADLASVLDRLRAHGLRYHTLAGDTTLAVERFHIDSLNVAEREYQGHHAQTLYGAYESSTQTVPAGTVIVPLDQPLGRLAFSLLEPRSDDGLVSWQVLDLADDALETYPVWRIPP